MTTQGNGSGGNGHKGVVETSVSAESEGGESIFHVAPPPGQLTKKDFVSNQEVRWCPGCGDYAILNNVQKVMPELGIPREKIVFVSARNCASVAFAGRNSIERSSFAMRISFSFSVCRAQNSRKTLMSSIKIWR